MLAVKDHRLYLKMGLHQEKVVEHYIIFNLCLFSNQIVKAAAAYRPPHLRQTTRQVPKLHDDVPAKPTTPQVPRVPKPGGVEEMFTGDLEKDKKIKQVHKVCCVVIINHLIISKPLEITTDQRS